MYYEIFGRKIRKVGVVGSGQIGPDIALHFAKSLCKYGVSVVVHDVVEKALIAGQDKLKKKIAKGVESGAFESGEADAMVKGVSFTPDKKELAGCDLVVEAASERIDIKRSIVRDLEQLCSNDAILASNSSHLEPEVIFADAKHPERCLGAHYFFPAERNRMIEIIPGPATSEAAVDFLMKFYEAAGKIPIRVRSRYGYAIDPVFEGIFLGAALCVQEELATAKQVDAIACKVLGLGVGPFTAMNLTGGNPITQEGLNLMHEKIMPWFKSPAILDEQIRSGKPWDVPARGDNVTYSEDQFKFVSESLLGVYFGLSCEILQSGIVEPGDFEMGAEIALVISPPLQMMNKMGVSRALELVRKYAHGHPRFVVSDNLVQQAKSGAPWEIPLVRREDRDSVAVLTIKRPAKLNALNQEVIAQLDKHVSRAKTDPSVRAVVITGYGSKAFVSGADIEMLASVRTPEEAEAVCNYFQKTLLLIENLGKPVVCAMNGLAFGGGSELALACTARTARAGVKTLVSQPEPKLGIIPGTGGTQRLPRLIGFERAWPMLRAVATISSEQAKEDGLVDRLFEGDVLEPSIRYALELAEGKAKPPSMPKGPVSVPPLPEVNIGPLSRKIDQILQTAILEGAAMPLNKALAFEARMFGECFKTKDGRIGLDNFIKTGLKQQPKFIHQ